MEIIKSILSQDGKLSSKRVAGLIGMAIIFVCYAYCCVTGKEMPGVTEFLAGACVTLLGIDPVTDIFKKQENAQSQE